MEKTNRGGRGGRSFGGGDRGGRSFGGDRGGRSDRGGRGGRDFNDRPEMFDAVCSDCGDDCQVPFKPSGSKPVLCSDCFRGSEGSRDRNDRGGRGDRGDRGGRNDRGGRREERRMHDAVCCECGRDFELPFRPSPDRPVYCSDCFEGKKGVNETHDGGDEDLTEYFEEKFNVINSKLDGILRLLKGEPEAKVAKKSKKQVKEVVAEVAEVVETAEAVEKPKKVAKKASKAKASKK